MSTDSPCSLAPGRYSRMMFLALPLIFLWRLFYIYIVPFDLFPDETYYWDWSRIPDLGYYSKPPMIAWLIGASTRLLGSHDVAVRLPAVLLGTLTLLGLFLFARRMYGERVAFWAVAALAATPENATLSIFMTTDTPLGLSWAFGLWAIWNAIETNSVKWWVIAGVITACGVLSKQMMLLFPVLTFLFLAFSSAERPRLRDPRLYLFVGISLSSLLPMLWWNRRNEWITLQHTAHHFEPRTKGTFAFASRFADFVGSQFLVISPLLFLLLAILTVCLFRRFRELERREKFLLIFGAVPLTAFLAMSFRQKMNPNWPSVYYHAALVLTAAWGTGAAASGYAVKWRKYFKPAVMIGAAMVVITYLLPWLVVIAGVDGGKLDPTVRMKGWHELARQVEVLRTDLPQRDRTFIMATERQIVSELAVYLPDQPRNYRWPGTDGIIRSQYELWPGPLDKIGWDALIVVKKGAKISDELKKSFEAVTPLADLVVPLGARGSRNFTVYRGDSLRSWPVSHGNRTALPE